MDDSTGIPPEVASAVRAGDMLAGKYRIERVLGAGGMGVVVSATHVQLDERVALKFLLPAALANQEAVARFAREARAAVKIKSEHVARVTDVGTLETGAPYMVMEYLDGSDLGNVVQEQGALPIPVAIGHVLQACEALAEAHSLGIIHRDLKPANLFLTRRADGSSVVKVLDFGISKMLSSTSQDFGMTKTATVMGSPLYMSPEQMASAKDVDARTDIWAIGAILYELVTGHVPFEAETLPQLCTKILQEPPPPLRSVRPDVPVQLEDAVMRCLEKDRTRRFSDVAEFANALLPFAPPDARTSVERVSRLLGSSSARDSYVSHTSLVTAASATGSGLTFNNSAIQAHSDGVVPRATQQAWGKTSRDPRRRGLVLYVLVGLSAVGALALAAGAFVFLYSRSDSTAAAASAEPMTANSGVSVSAAQEPAAPETSEPPSKDKPATLDSAAAAIETASPSAAPAPEDSVEVKTPTAAPAKVRVATPRPAVRPVKPVRVAPKPSPKVTPKPTATTTPIDLYQDRK